MGYEVELYLGEPRKWDNEAVAWFNVVAQVDLSKPYYGLAALAESSDKQGVPVYIYSNSDGNTRIVKDKYDKKLTAIPAAEVLALMLKEAKTNKGDYGGNGYRRYNMAIPLLKAFIKDFKEPYVVMFGH